jgi:ribonuclease T2
LWPQYEKGFPEFCQVPAPRLDRNIVASMLDLMPARRLVYHQWDKHGTCSGLNQRAYFETIRKARAQVKIPEEYLELTRVLTVTPNAVEEAFIKANPGLTRAGIAVTCNSHRMSEVRICLSRDFRFRDCHEIDRRACRRSEVVMPPVRGGSVPPRRP